MGYILKMDFLGVSNGLYFLRNGLFRDSKWAIFDK